MHINWENNFTVEWYRNIDLFMNNFINYLKLIENSSLYFTETIPMFTSFLKQQLQNFKRNETIDASLKKQYLFKIIREFAL